MASSFRGVDPILHQNDCQGIPIRVEGGRKTKEVKGRIQYRKENLEYGEETYIYILERQRECASERRRFVRRREGRGPAESEIRGCKSD